MTFEQNPILLVVFAVATIEGWTLAKAAVRSLLERRRKTAAARRRPKRRDRRRPDDER